MKFSQCVSKVREEEVREAPLLWRAMSLETPSVGERAAWNGVITYNELRVSGAIIAPRKNQGYVLLN